MYEVGIYSTGYYVPKNVITDEMIQPRLDLIKEGPAVGVKREMLGVKESRFVSKDETATDMAYEATLNAIENAKIDKSEIDLIIYNSSTPDHLGSPDGYLLQHKLEIYDAAAITIVSGCSGFMSAITTGLKYVSDGTYKTVLVVCSEAVSKICNIESDATGIEKSGALNAGDAAAAVILRRLKKGKKGIISTDLGGDGRGYEVLMVPAGGLRMPATVENVKAGLTYARMDDNNFAYGDKAEHSVSATVQFAAESFTKGVTNVLNRAKLTVNDIDWLIPHQPNLGLITTLAKRYGIPLEKMLISIDKYACPWSATTPLTLAIENEKNSFKSNDVIVMVAFGGGFGYGAVCFRWNNKNEFEED